MRTLVAVILLGALAAQAPVPRKPTNDSAGRRNRSTRQSERDTGPANAAVAALDLRKTDPQKEPNTRIAGPNEQVTVHVTSLPNIEIKKDWRDSAYWGFSALLAIVGLLQVWLLCGTLRATKASADAAKLNAEAAIASNAAWLRVDVEKAGLVLGPIYEGEVHYFEGAKANPTTVNFRLRYTNIGKTPAWVSSRRAKLKVFENLPTNPDFGICEYLKTEPEIIEPGQTGESIETSITTSESRRGGANFKLLVLYGFIEFRDAFDRERRASFGYAVDSDSALSGDPFRRLMGYVWNRNSTEG